MLVLFFLFLQIVCLVHMKPSNSKRITATFFLGGLGQGKG